MKLVKRISIGLLICQFMRSLFKSMVSAVVNEKSNHESDEARDTYRNNQSAYNSVSFQTNIHESIAGQRFRFIMNCVGLSGEII